MQNRAQLIRGDIATTASHAQRGVQGVWVGGEGHRGAQRDTDAEPSRFIVLATQTQTFKTYTLGVHKVFPHAARAGIFTWHTQLATSIYTFTKTFQGRSTALLQTDSNCNGVVVYLIDVNVVVYLLL